MEQTQLNKILELLKLPQDNEVFVGQVNSCTKYSLVENRFIDKTYVDENFKRIDKITSNFTSVPKTIEMGLYNHNLISTYIHSYGFDVIGFIGSEYRMNKEGIDLTITVGPFAGQTYHFNWQEVSIKPTNDGFDFRLESEPWMNTQPNGLPALDKKVSIERRTTTKIGNVRIIPSKNQVTITNIRNVGPTKDYPSYTKSELETKTGWDEYQIAESMATVFHMKFKNPDTHCVALGTDIEIFNESLTGVVYINGLKSKDINYRSLISSYNKLLPDFVTRWKVYHSNNMSGSLAYGTALPVIENNSNENNTINIIKGSKLGFDSTTRILTYIEGTSLVFDFEFLPAQGKNETWGSTIDLDTLQENIY